MAVFGQRELKNAIEDASLRGACRSIWKHRSLIWQLIKRDVSAKYRGLSLGMAWVILQPLLMLVLYTFVFSTVFKARWNIPGADSTLSFGLVLWIGLTTFNVFSEGLTRAPNLITSHANYVKKVVFPLELLPVVALGTALFGWIVNTTILIIALVGSGTALQLGILQIPLLLVPLALLTLGLMWFLAAMGVYLRDTAQTIGLIVTALMFMSPVFYPVSSVPEAYRVLLQLNPVSFYIEQARLVTFDSMPLDYAGLAVHAAFSLLVAAGGFAVFQRVRKGFADVL